MAHDRVAVDGATGRARPETLKVSLGYRDGYIGEGQISYAGSGAVARARLAAAVVPRPAGALGDCARRPPLRPDRHQRPARRGDVGRGGGARTRCASASPRAHRRREAAERIGEEVEALYTNGPAGGGGATRSVREVLAIASTFVPRALVPCTVQLEVA